MWGFSLILCFWRPFCGRVTSHLPMSDAGALQKNHNGCHWHTKKHSMRVLDGVVWTPSLAEHIASNKHNHRKSTRITMLSSKLKAPWTVPSMGNSAHHSFNLANYALHESLKIHDSFLIFSNPLPKVLTKSGPLHVLGQDRTPCTGNEARTCLQPEKQCNLSQEWDRFTWTMTRRLCSHCRPQKRTAAWSEPVGRTLNSFLKAIFNART